jgi:hypothetical protein
MPILHHTPLALQVCSLVHSCAAPLFQFQRLIHAKAKASCYRCFFTEMTEEGDALSSEIENIRPAIKRVLWKLAGCP